MLFRKFITQEEKDKIRPAWATLSVEIRESASDWRGQTIVAVVADVKAAAARLCIDQVFCDDFLTCWARGYATVLGYTVPVPRGTYERRKGKGKGKRQRQDEEEADQDQGHGSRRMDVDEDKGNGKRKRCDR
jgi:hypothetical protein